MIFSLTQYLHEVYSYAISETRGPVVTEAYIVKALQWPKDF